MRATVCFSIEHARPRVAYVKKSNDITISCFARNIRDFKIQRRDGNENAKKKKEKNNRFNKQITTLHLHHTFLYISLPFLHDLRPENA